MFLIWLNCLISKENRDELELKSKKDFKTILLTAWYEAAVDHMKLVTIWCKYYDLRVKGKKELEILLSWFIFEYNHRRWKKNLTVTLLWKSQYCIIRILCKKTCSNWKLIASEHLGVKSWKMWKSSGKWKVLTAKALGKKPQEALKGRPRVQGSISILNLQVLGGIVYKGYFMIHLHV